MDEVVVRLPSREWAECAVEDLATEGCQAVVEPVPAADGTWALRITGPADKIAEIRYATQVPACRVDWAEFVNSVISGQR